MRTGPQSIKFLNSVGYTDRKIGEWYDISREHINRIKNGKEQGSLELLEDLHEDCEVHIRATKKYAKQPYEEVSDDSPRPHDPIEAEYTAIDIPSSRKLVPYDNSQEEVQNIIYPNQQVREVIRYVPVYIEKEVIKEIQPPKEETTLERYRKKYKGMSLLEELVARDKELAERMHSKKSKQDNIHNDTFQTSAQQQNLIFYEQNVYRNHTDF